VYASERRHLAPNGSWRKQCGLGDAANQAMKHVALNLRDHQTDPGQRTWDLPPWGHLLSKCVLPLFIQAEGRYHPIGTAFWVGPKVQFIVTAMHTILEAFRFEPRLERLLTADELPLSATLNCTSLSVLHQDDVTDTKAQFSLVPVRTINGAPPGDVAFGHPEFINGRTVLSLPLSFDPPRIGETVWSVGYTDIRPRDGIPMEAVTDGSFDWAREYHHRFVVTEGQVGRIFTQSFAGGSNRGPCFSFDNEIPHGTSGGPVISERGVIVGINSRDASIMFNRPSSLSSMLYPLLLTDVDFGATLGIGNFVANMKARRPLIDLVMNRVISSDRSEEHVAIHRSNDGEGFAVGPRIPAEDQAFVHEDFRAFQDRRPGLPISGEFYGFTRNNEASSELPNIAGGAPMADDGEGHG
jgi:hypothetical protein